MGIKFVVTGFGKFQGVEENPTEVLVSDLSALLQQSLLKLHGALTPLPPCSLGLGRQHELQLSIPQIRCEHGCLVAGDSEVASCTVLQVAIRGLDSWFNSIFNNLPAVLQPTDDVVVVSGVFRTPCGFAPLLTAPGL